MKAFINWLIDQNHFGKLSADDKHCWYNNAMNIDFEMEKRGCSFEDCLCDMTVPVENFRHVIPWQYYDDFGLLNKAERDSIWAVGKPESDLEANMLLHKERRLMEEIV
jgi:hypothetical protein